MKKVMVIDDEQEITDILEVFLIESGYSVIKFNNAIDALNDFNDSYTLIILDIGMPEMDGITFCRAIRRISNIPILFLTARVQEVDIVRGLNAGGDDYLTKPFKRLELTARVDALIRRYEDYLGKNNDVNIMSLSGLTIDKSQRIVTKNNNEISLLDKEYKILCLLASHPGRVYSISEIYESIWNEPYLSDSANTVMVHIRLLRKKIEDDPANPKIIKNIWGRGYQIERGGGY